MILLIDNYDSFVHNLARYFARAGWAHEIVRNDAITPAEIEALAPEAIALSPGPCTPEKAGICVDLVKRLGPHIPMLGVCLGHQCMGEAYGGETYRINKPMHGKASKITHNERGLFEGLPSPICVGRYHSLLCALPENSALQITARHGEDIMAVQHETHPVYGVQFHPESVLTEHGLQMVENFTRLALRWNKCHKRAA